MSYGIQVTSQVDINAGSGKSGYINTDTNAFTRVCGRGSGVGLLQEDTGGSFEVARFQNHTHTGPGNKKVRINVMTFNYGHGWQYENTMTPGHIRIGKVAKDWPYPSAQTHEGGELQMVAPDDQILSLDAFNDPNNYLKMGSTKYNFRFFNASNGQLFGAISEKGMRLDRGWLKIFHEDASVKNTHVVLYKKYTGATKKLFDHNMVKDNHYEGFRVQTTGTLNEANPASIIDATSLWFRNNELYGKWNGSGEIKRGMKCAIDPSGNIITVKSLIANHKFSDFRLKKDINKIDSTDALDKVKQLRGVTFQWKDGEGDPGTKVGLIAQEVQKIVPEIVTTKP